MAKLMDRARQELVGINKCNAVGNSEVAFIAEELDARAGGDKTGERQVFIETEARARPECAHLLALRWRQVRVHGVSGPRCVIAHSAGLHGSVSSVFKRSGNRFASRKRVKSRIWSPASIPSKREGLQ